MLLQRLCDMHQQSEACQSNAWTHPSIPSSLGIVFYAEAVGAEAACRGRACSRLRPQVSQFLFGNGFAITEGDDWRVRRKAVQPSLHRAYLDLMIQKVFGPSAVHLSSKLEVGCLLLMQAA